MLARAAPALLEIDLGVAEARVGQGAAIAHLRTSLELTSGPSRRAVRALDLANALLGLGSPTDAYDLLESAIEDLGGRNRELGLHLEAQALTIGQIELTLTRRARIRFERLEPLAGETPGERLVLGALALERKLVGAPADEVLDLAERALADGRLLVEQAPDSPIFYHAVAALGGDPRAEQLLSRACQEARGRGSLLGQRSSRRSAPCCCARAATCASSRRGGQWIARQPGGRLASGFPAFDRCAADRTDRAGPSGRGRGRAAGCGHASRAARPALLRPRALRARALARRAGTAG